MLVSAGCSLIATRPLSPSAPIDPGVEPECSQSNWAAGVDFVARGRIRHRRGGGSRRVCEPRPHVHDANERSTGSARRGDRLGGVAVLSAYSMFRGFDRSRECRVATAQAGLVPHGDNDWTIAPLTLIVVGLVVAAQRGGGGSEPMPVDLDLCRPGQIRTALCRDGVYSCSLNRSGTCSHHQGVATFL